MKIETLLSLETKFGLKMTEVKIIKLDFHLQKVSLKVLKYLFFLVRVLRLDQSKGKIYFLTKIMHLNEIQACFVSLCSFRANVFQIKLDNISFPFKV